MAMVLEDAKAGDSITTPAGELTLLQDVEFAHKVNILPLKKGQAVIKYREEIGFMLEDAPAGSWIHNHNMGCERGKK